MEVFTNLKKLNLTNNNITDISPINNLKHITSLDLSNNANINIYNKETEESFLPNKENLEELNISNTNNSDISFVSQLPNLKILKASNNGISSTEELKTLSKIEILDLSYNTAIVKIDDILSLAKLKNLNISTTGITSLLHSKSEEGEDEYGIFVLENLEELNISNNQLISIDPVLKTYLEITEIEGVVIDVKEKAYLEKLEQLNFNYTRQSNINYERLILLKNLTHLYMKGNQIEYLSDYITKLDNLEYINLSDNLLTDINSFMRIEGITDEDIETDILGMPQYDVEGNPILKENPNVTYFEDEYGNMYKKIILKATQIELAHNKITDITPLSHLNHDIKYLDLSENAVYDVTIIDSGRFSFGEGLKLQKQGVGWDEPIYYMPIKEKEASVNQYIILPTLFQNSKKERKQSIFITS